MPGNLPVEDEWIDSEGVRHRHERIDAMLADGNFGGAANLLHGLLPIAVAIVIDQVRNESWPLRMERLGRIKKRWAAEGRESFSEALLTKEGAKPGESKTEFSDLAQMLGVMAFCPGGVRAFGWHWEEVDDP